MTHRLLEYIVLGVVTMLLQLFFISNLNITPYIVPFIYLSLVILLPTKINKGVLLLLAFLCGAIVDFSSGGAGLNTIAILAMTVIRPILLRITLGEDEIRDNISPIVSKMGQGKFIRYSSVLTLVYTVTYFSFEAMMAPASWFILAKISLSWGISTLLTYAVQQMFSLFKK